MLLMGTGDDQAIQAFRILGSGMTAGESTNFHDMSVRTEIRDDSTISIKHYMNPISKNL